MISPNQLRGVRIGNVALGKTFVIQYHLGLANYPSVKALCHFYSCLIVLTCQSWSSGQTRIMIGLVVMFDYDSVETSQVPAAADTIVLRGYLVQ